MAREKFRNSGMLPQNIDSLDKFKFSLEARCQEIINEKDPEYIYKIKTELDKYQDIFKAFENFKAWNKCLNRNYTQLANLLGALHEARRGWIRLLDVYSLLGTEPPVINYHKIPQERWWKFCSDSVWFADYGFSERLITFFKKLKRMITLNVDNRYIEEIENAILTIEGLRETTKEFRDRLVHKHSILLDDDVIDLFWQMFLAIGYKVDFPIEPFNALDSFGYLANEAQKKDLHDWIRAKYDITNKIFNQLNKMPLERLILVKEHSS